MAAARASAAKVAAISPPPEACEAFAALVRGLAAPWVAWQCAGARAEAVPPLLLEAPLRAACLRAVCDGLKDAHRTVLVAAHAAIAPEVLPALQALLGATLALPSRPRPLRPLASLLRLLLAAISTFGERSNWVKVRVR